MEEQQKQICCAPDCEIELSKEHVLVCKCQRVGYCSNECITRDYWQRHRLECPAAQVVIEESELPDSVTKVVHNGVEIWLVGTAHVSKKSSEECARMVRMTKPDVLVLELCNSRRQMLQPPSPAVDDGDDGDGADSSFSSVKRAMTSQPGLSGAFGLGLSYMYKKIARDLDVIPGQEFRSAHQAAGEIGRPCMVVLGDRDVSVTLSRAWAKLSLWHKVKLLGHIIYTAFADISKEEIEKLKQADILAEMVKEFSSEFPVLADVILTERDVYLARSIRKAANTVAPKGRVVAVLGLGHIKGILATWQSWDQAQTSDEQMDRQVVSYTHVPPTPFTWRRMMAGGALLTLGGFVGTIYAIKSLFF